MASERLVVTMEAKDQLSPALKKVGAAAKDTADEIKKITSADVADFGRSMLRGAASLATGLYGLAKASSDLAEAQNFSNQIFKEAAPAINKFAEGAATALGMSERAALDAAASVGIFGQRINLTGPDLAKFSTDLVTLAADMASIKNTKPEEAVTAIAAAMRNEYEPIRRYGVVLNDVVLKARSMAQGLYDGTGQLTQQQKIIAVNAELFDQLGFAIGDFTRTQGELANQTRIAQAQFENLQANLGDALRPAFIKAMGAANQALAVFQKIPGPVKEIAAKVALIGTGMLGLGGGVLFAAGKIGTLVGSFRDLKARLDASATAGSRWAGAASKMASATAAIGIAAAGINIAVDAYNDVIDVAGRATSALEKFNIAAADRSVLGVQQAFSDLAKTSYDTARLAKVWEVFGDTIRVTAGGAKVDIEDVDRAWAKLGETGPEAQARLIASWEEELSLLDRRDGRYKEVIELLDRYRPKLEQNIRSTQAYNEELGTLSDDTLAKYTDGLDEASIGEEKAAAATEEHAKAVEFLTDVADEAVAVFERNIEALAEYAAMVGEVRDAIGEAERSFDTAAETADSFADALAQTTGTSALIDNVVSIQEAFDNLTESFKDSEGNFDPALTSLNAMDDAGRKNIRSMDELATIFNDRLMLVYRNSGGDMAQVVAAQAAMRDELAGVLRQAGLTEGQIADYLALLNETPESIETAIKLRDQDVAMKKLEMLNLQMDELPPEVVTAITAEMDEGDWISAYQIAKNWASGHPVNFGMELDDPTTPVVEGIAGAQIAAFAHPISVVSTAEPVVGVPGVIAGGQAIANATPLLVPAQAEPVTGIVGAVGEAQGVANSNPVHVPGEADPVTGVVGAVSEAQGVADANPINVVPVADAVVGVPDAISTAQGTADNNPIEVPVETGTPTGMGTAFNSITSFFFGKKPTVTVDAKPGDYSKAYSTISGFFLRSKPTTTAETKPGTYMTTWNTINNFFRSNKPTTTAETKPGNYVSTWNTINSYFRGHNVTTTAVTKASGMSSTWSEIQGYFNGRPVSVRVNAVPGSVSMPRVPGTLTTTYTPRPPGVAVPVASGMARIPAPVAMGQPAPASTASVINLTVNMPSGTNEVRVVDLLKRYVRSNGQGIFAGR